MESLPAGWQYPVLFAAGILVSFINSISGGGSVLSLPLLIFMGLPSATANGTNRLGVLAGALSSLAAFRSLGHFLPRLAWQVGWPAALGSLAGSLAAVRLPDRVFKPILALIIIFVVIMSVRSQASNGQSAESLKLRGDWLARLAYLGIGLYGGFIQAGSGFLMIAAFRRLGNLDAFQVNALKVFNTVIFISVSLLVFAAAGRVDWGMAAALAAGNGLGGWAGSHWQVKKGREWVDRFILVTGLAMAGKLLWDTFA